MKVSILSNINVDILPRFLKHKGSEIGYKFQDFYIGGFNQYVQEILNEDSDLYKFSPDLVLLHLEGTALFENIFFDCFSYTYVKLNNILKERVKELWRLVETFNQRCPQCLMFLNTVTISPHTIGGGLETNSDILSMHMLCSLFNKELIKQKLLYNLSSTFIAEWEKVVFYEGFKHIYDARYWYIGRIPYNNYGFEKLAETYVSLLNSVKGKIKKVIILDLDNTLWGGIIGEDGLEGIKLSEDGIGKAYRDFQKLLKSSKDKGILLAIVSKNNPEDAEEVFEKHPLMVLKKDDFVSIKVNWRDKVRNICEMAKELNLGLDSFLFIDDNPVEREMVKNALPEVTVPNFPEDPAYLVQWFSEISERYFNKTSLTKEDKERTQMYKAESKRIKLLRKASSIGEFLASLNMKAIIYKNHKEMVNRLAQLTQRTNQFNLRTKRYTENDILSFMESKDYYVWDLELIDKFGTNGIVGLIIVKLNKNLGEAFIDTFLMSCRIIGREVEKVFVSYIASILKKTDIKKIIGEYIPTKKNKLVKDVYGKLGFKKVEEKQNGISIWELSLINFDPIFPKYIEIEEKDEYFGAINEDSITNIGNPRERSNS